MQLTLDNVLTATGGVVGPEVDRAVSVETVSTDSRRAQPGALFVALRGPNHDGHDFVAQAMAEGAQVALVERVVPGVEAERQIRVADTAQALGDLAAWVRRHYPTPVVAITGSNGKTTTKELIASVCAAAGWRVLKTEGNLNNLIGLPLTVLGARGDEAIRVLEMGMNRPGEIARLTEIARPDVAVVTNVGPAHLEGVGGTLAGVAAAKGELVAGLAAEACVAVNGDDAWVRRIAMPFRGRKVVFGTGGEVRAREVRDLGGDGLAFTLEVVGATADLRLRLVGVHNVTNALAAAAVGHALGLGADAIAAGLARAEGPAMRMRATRLANGVTIIDDAYNANPSSMEAALRALTRLPGRAVAVLGEMRELGDEGRRAHHVLGERAATLGVSHLVVLGAYAEAVAAGAVAAGMPQYAVSVCASHSDAARAVVAQWQPGDAVLVKGSRAMRMEIVVRLLTEAGDVP